MHSVDSRVAENNLYIKFCYLKVMYLHPCCWLAFILCFSFLSLLSLALISSLYPAIVHYLQFLQLE